MRHLPEFGRSAGPWSPPAVKVLLPHPANTSTSMTSLLRYLTYSSTPIKHTGKEVEKSSKTKKVPSCAYINVCSLLPSLLLLDRARSHNHWLSFHQSHSTVDFCGPIEQSWVPNTASLGTPTSKLNSGDTRISTIHFILLAS